MHKRLDIETLKKRFAGRPHILERLCSEFYKHVQKALAEMQEALEARDLKSLEDKVHTLKGNAALIGAMRISKLAHDIEQACAIGDEQFLISSLPELAQEAELTLDELQKFHKSKIQV